MKINFTIFILFSLFIFIISFENLAEVKKRFNFYKNLEKFTNNSVSVGYNPEGGLHCIANRDIEVGSHIIRVPKKNSFCAYDLYPFKFEIFNALKSDPTLAQSPDKEQKFGMFLMAYYVLYITKANKGLIKEYIINNKLEQYYNVTEYDESIIDSFPKIFLGGWSLNLDQYSLLSELRYGMDHIKEIERIFNVVKFILLNTLHNEIVIHWIYSFEEFQNAYSLAMSRAISIRYNEYKIAHNIHPVNLTGYQYMNYEMNRYFTETFGAPCLISFVDLCNHAPLKKIDMSDKRQVIITAEKDYFINICSKDYSAGDKIEFTYSNDPSNFALFINYGFIVPNNILNAYNVRVIEDKALSISQFNLCRELGCIDGSIKDPLNIPKMRVFIIKNSGLSQELVNLGRVKFMKGEINNARVIKKILNDQPVSFENEIKAWSFYLSKMLDEVSIPFRKSIKRIQVCRNERLSLEKTINTDSLNDLELWKTIKNFELIYELDRSYRGILYKHKNWSLRRIISNFKNNINDLKKKYLKSN